VTPLPLPDDLQQHFGDALGVAADGCWELTLEPEAAREALQFLGCRREPPFSYFIALCGADTGDGFEAVYLISRVCTGEVLRVRVILPRRGPKLPSVADIWPGATWPEREIMEMYGIAVEEQPDVRHLLLPEGWKGFPLRKDYVYPVDHPYLRRDPLREDPDAVLGTHATPESETPAPESDGGAS
jgi:NADH:ubiquinone oxidoreductase subunit C